MLDNNKAIKSKWLRHKGRHVIHNFVFIDSNRKSIQVKTNHKLTLFTGFQHTIGINEPKMCRKRKYLAKEIYTTIESSEQ